MWWPFTKRMAAKPRAAHSRLVQVTVDQNITSDGKVIGGTAYFTDDPTVLEKADVPIDALGRLALAHPERCGLKYVDLTRDELPTERKAKHGRLYLAAREFSVGWTAYLGGLDISPPVCKCKNHSVDWHLSKLWPNRNRAVGMLIFECKMMLGVFVNYDDRYRIKLQHPDDPTSDGAQGDGHCCCSGP